MILSVKSCRSQVTATVNKYNTIDKSPTVQAFRDGEQDLKSWKIEPSPTGWPYPLWIWNLPHDYWVGAFGEVEASRAVEVLGDADRYPSHADAMTVIDAGWAFVTTGKRLRGAA